MRRLTRALVKAGAEAGADADLARLVELPEKVVQFGTGAFLRGFVEYFIDAANRAGVFNGRVVAIGSTDSGRDRRLAEQDCLYNLAIQGFEDGQERKEFRLITALCRALSARAQWDDVLACARNPELELIFSNTTEIGIRLNQDDRFEDAPPSSFPAKLTRFLHERAITFDYDSAKGVVVLPCELIENNGAQLEQLVREQAARWHLEPRFFAWLDNGVTFCNTLVDRIVPGEASAEEKRVAAQQLGYEDALLTNCEPYRLFAIEANADIRGRISFAAADEGVILTDDITPYRNRKIRLLNGAHTLLAPLGLLAGCETVSEAINHEMVGAFARVLVIGELAPSMGTLDAEPYGQEVLQRFANPFIQHALLDITLQQTTKMAVRVVPAIRDYAARTQAAPGLIALGFAAYLLFLRDPRAATRPDEKAAAIRDLPIERVLSNASLWGSDLTAVPGFQDEVVRAFNALQRRGPRAAIYLQLVSFVPATTQA